MERLRPDEEPGSPSRPPQTQAAPPDAGGHLGVPTTPDDVRSGREPAQGAAHDPEQEISPPLHSDTMPERLRWSGLILLVIMAIVVIAILVFGLAPFGRVS